MRLRRPVLIIACLAVFYTIVLWQCQPEPTPPEVKAEIVHRLYLPIIYSKPKSALHGVCGGDLDKIGADWAYNWTWDTQGNPRLVPMIRDVTKMDHLLEAVENAKASRDWLMGFNEPDKPEPYGHLTTPAEGADAWRAIEKAATDIKLLSPAPSQDDPDWLWQMVAAYKSRYGGKPRFDAIGVHYYSGCPPDIEGGKRHLLRVRREALAHGYDVPLWSTEFGGWCVWPNPRSGNERMMRELIPWMKERPWIARYSWFMSLIPPDVPWLPGDFSSCSLIDWQTRELSELGRLYKELK